MKNQRFVSWLETELRERDLSLRGLGRKTGIGYSTVSRWLTGSTDPSASNLDILAAYFDVDTRFLYELLGRVEPSSIVDLDATEKRIIETYRSLGTVEERRRFLRIAEVFSFYDVDEDSQPVDPQPMKP